MPQSKKRQRPQKDQPLRTNIIYAPPSAEGDACFLRALKILMDAAPEPELWRFTGPDGPISVRVSGAFIANDSQAVHRAARAGHGIASLPEIQLIDDLRAGRLFRLLEDYPSQRVPVQIVYPSRRNLAPRTRVVMDFLVEQTREISVLLEQGAEVLT